MSSTNPHPIDPHHHTIPPVFPKWQSHREPPDLPEGISPQDFWVFLPSSFPGYSFRRDSTAWHSWRHATVFSSAIRISNDGGIYAIEQAGSSHQQTGSDEQNAGATTGSTPTTIAPELILGTKGEAYHMTFLSKPLADLWTLGHKLTSIPITLQAGIDSNGTYQSEERVTGVAVIGDRALWTIAPLDTGEHDPRTKARMEAAHQVMTNIQSSPSHQTQTMRVFLFAPLQVVVEKTGLLAAQAGLITTVWTFRACALTHDNNEVGAVLVPHPTDNPQPDLLYGTSIIADSEEDILQCLRFGGGGRNAAFVECAMRVLQADRSRTFGAHGFAVVYDGSMARLCEDEVTERLVSKMREEIAEAQGS